MTDPIDTSRTSVHMLIAWNDRPAPAVAVKPLEWEAHQDYCSTEEKAETVLGTWTVWTAKGDAYYRGPNDSAGTCIPGASGCKVKAKAAAQDDYERRILSALTPTPDITSERERAALCAINPCGLSYLAEERRTVEMVKQHIFQLIKRGFDPRAEMEVFRREPEAFDWDAPAQTTRVDALREALQACAEDMEAMLEGSENCGDPGCECPMQDAFNPGSTSDIAKRARATLALIDQPAPEPIRCAECDCEHGYHENHGRLRALAGDESE